MIPAFLLKNPLASIAGIVAAGAIVVAGVQTVRLAWAHSEIAGIELAHEKAVREAQQRADDLANELIIAQAAAMAVTEKKVISYVDRIRTVQAPDTACAADERMRLGSHGVRDVLGLSNAQRGAPAAVQGPGAGAGP